MLVLSSLSLFWSVWDSSPLLPTFSDWSFDISLIYTQPCPECGSRPSQVDNQYKWAHKPPLDAGSIPHSDVGSWQLSSVPPPSASCTAFIICRATAPEIHFLVPLPVICSTAWGHLELQKEAKWLAIWTQCTFACAWNVEEASWKDMRMLFCWFWKGRRRVRELGIQVISRNKKG